jgi:hypothetical protein
VGIFFDQKKGRSPHSFAVSSLDTTLTRDQGTDHVFLSIAAWVTTVELVLIAPTPNQQKHLQTYVSHK